MSVAFRRDSDEEHLEPKFELPIPNGPNLVTARGLAMIKARRTDLEAKLKELEDPATAAPVQRELRYWQNRELTAELAPVPSGAKVEFGTEVSILLQGKPRTFGIVGDDEADPAAGLVSFKAPLSKAMLGAETGDLLPFGDAPDAIEVLAIKVLDADAGA
jgi:transcription elongation GreA/GreB family factor